MDTYYEKRSYRFFERARSKHGDRYDYSKTIYAGAKTSLTITCTSHGDFSTSADSHTSLGTGCPQCAGNTLSNINDFRRKARVVHGETYSYDNSVYAGAHQKITIACQIHGLFDQTPRSHLNGRGCPKCGGKEKVSFQNFVERAQAIHGDRYEYSESSFKKMLDKTEINCANHGVFYQTPALHLSQKQGCPKCKPHYSKKESVWLDQIGLPNDKDHRQVAIPIPGYTRRQVVDGYDRSTNTVFEFHGDIWHGNPRKFAADSKNPITNTPYGELFKRTQQRDSAIRSAGYNLIVMWEGEFSSSQKGDDE